VKAPQFYAAIQTGGFLVVVGDGVEGEAGMTQTDQIIIYACIAIVFASLTMTATGLW